jgi:HPt (histidine-containing phosphotransfer) domain-containing protein
MTPSEPMQFVDFVALRRQLASYDALLETLLALFLEQAPLWLIELEEAFSAQDMMRVRHLCHKIKGGAATLQADYIVRAAAELSLQAADGDLLAAGESRDRLISAINGTMAFVQASAFGKPRC